MRTAGRNNTFICQAPPTLRPTLFVILIMSRSIILLIPLYKNVINQLNVVIEKKIILRNI